MALFHSASSAPKICSSRPIASHRAGVAAVLQSGRTSRATRERSVIRSVTGDGGGAEGILHSNASLRRGVAGETSADHFASLLRGRVVAGHGKGPRLFHRNVEIPPASCVDEIAPNENEPSSRDRG